VYPRDASFSTIALAICEADTPVASAVFRHFSRTARTASWCSLDSLCSQLRVAGDGFALSRISAAKSDSILLALEVNPPVVVGYTAAGNVLVIVVIRENEVFRWGWHGYSVAQ
jgi:hypothetical protein